MIMSWCTARPARSSGSRSIRPKRTWPPTRAIPHKRVPTMMTTADMALKMDPDYRKISERFRDRSRSSSTMPSPAPGSSCATATWGPRCVTSAPKCPPKTLIWQDPVPAGTMPSDAEVAAVQGGDRRISGLTVSELVKTAWASASPTAIRTTAAVPMARASGWHRKAAGRSTIPQNSAKVLGVIDALRGSLSMADAIVLAGSAAVEKAAKDAGFDVTVPFTGGRGDATDEQTDADKLRTARAVRRRVPQLPAKPRRRCAPRRCCSTGRICWACRSRN